MADLEQPDQKAFSFYKLGRRQVVARFGGGDISSDGGALLLREVERITGITRQFADCFIDHRDQERIEHPLGQLIAQRVFALALGYEDLNDHDTLRRDPMLALAVGKEDLRGASRENPRDVGKALAGKSILNRLELSPADAGPETPYKKIGCRLQAMEELFVKLFIQAHLEPPKRIVLDGDSTDDPLHGQEGGFSMATTATTATSRCTSSAVSTCFWLGCAAPTSTPRKAPSKT